MQNAQSTIRKATNVTLAANLLAEAKLLKINISKAAESGVVQAVAAKRAELWLEENRAALDSSNEYFNKSGLPLARHRMF